MTTPLWPGRPHPLGATWDGEGTNFALFSATAEAVDLCLPDDHGIETPIPPAALTFHPWHGYLPHVGPGPPPGSPPHRPSPLADATCLRVGPRRDQSSPAAPPAGSGEGGWAGPGRAALR